MKKREITDGTYRMQAPKQPRKPEPQTFPSHSREPIPGWMRGMIVLGLIILAFAAIGEIGGDEPIEPLNQGKPRVVTETVTKTVKVPTLPEACAAALSRTNQIGQDSMKALDITAPQTDVLSASRQAILSQDFNAIAEAETAQRKLGGSFAGTRNDLSSDLQTFRAELSDCKKQLAEQ